MCLAVNRNGVVMVCRLANANAIMFWFAELPERQQQNVVCLLFSSMYLFYDVLASRAIVDDTLSTCGEMWQLVYRCHVESFSVLQTGHICND